MQYQSFSLPWALASYMVHVYLEFVGRRSTAQSSSEIFLKLHLLWDVLWLLGSAYFSLHKFSRIYVRHALLFAVSDNMEYNIVSYFCKFFKWGGELVRRARIFIVEVAMKFGVLLAILRNEAKKIPRNLASCLVLTCVFDTKKFI